MIRQLRPSDLPRQLLPGRLAGPDLAFVHQALTTSAGELSLLQLARLSTALPSHHRALVLVEGLYLRAMAEVRPRHGARAWELAHLYASPAALVRCGELLDECSAMVARQGGDRLFLRLSQDSPVQVVARRAGFFPGFTEEVLQHKGPLMGAEAPMSLGLRPLSGADQYGLFRLYNACVPAPVRSAYGLTLEQWTDSQEHPSGRVAEYVWDQGGELRGWLRVARQAGATTLEGMLHPDESAVAALLCAEAARRLGTGGVARWLVPGHQPALAWALHETGWETIHTYTVLIRQIAKGVRDLAMAPVQA